LLAFARGFLPALLVATAVFAAVIPGSAAQTGPNSDPTYLELRNITLGSEAVSVANFDLKRDAGTFRLHSGIVCFVPPVNGRVTGAVFAGDGSFVLNPPTQAERKSLKYLTKEDEFNEKFERLVLRFSDSTYDEIKKAGTPASGGCDAGPLKHNAAQDQDKSGSPAPRGDPQSRAARDVCRLCARQALRRQRAL
jgi:hypothetical protein